MANIPLTSDSIIAGTITATTSLSVPQTQCACFFLVSPTSIPAVTWTTMALANFAAYGPNAPSLSSNIITINNTGVYSINGSFSSSFQNFQLCGIRLFLNGVDLGVYGDVTNSSTNNNGYNLGNSLHWVGTITSGQMLVIQGYNNAGTVTIPETAYSGVANIAGKNSFTIIRLI